MVIRPYNGIMAITNYVIWHINTLYIFCILQAKSEAQLWSAHARQKVLQAILNEWVKLSSKKTTVKNMIPALSFPRWFDVKLKVEKMLEENVPES